MVVEVVAGLATGSLALLSDAGHMLTDVLGLGMALAAIHAGQPRRPSAAHRTFGLYRLEILAALANAVLLFGVAVYVLVEAVAPLRRPARRARRRRCWSSPSLGLVANLVAFALLRAGAKESLNVEGAYLEVLADTVGSVGVIVGAVVIERHRLGVGRPGRRRRHRRVDPAPHLAARRARRCASSCRPRPPGIDLDAIAGRPRRPRRRRRRPRPARLDADLGHGGGLRPPDGRAPAPTPTRCSTRPGRCCASATASTTPPCRSSPTTTRLRRGGLVSPDAA